MTKIIRMSSEENVKYLTFELDKNFTESFHKFLSDIGISRDKRKNLFKDHYVYVKSGSNSIGYNDTLQIIHNKENIKAS